MIESVLLGLAWVTIFGCLYGAIRYHGNGARYWGWFLASGIAWTGYGIATSYNGWHWTWNVVWSFLVGLQLANAFIYAGHDRRAKERERIRQSQADRFEQFRIDK